MANYKSLETANHRIDVLTETLERLLMQIVLKNDGSFCRKLDICSNDIEHLRNCQWDTKNTCIYRKAKKVLRVI